MKVRIADQMDLRVLLVRVVKFSVAESLDVPVVWNMESDHFKRQFPNHHRCSHDA